MKSKQYNFFPSKEELQRLDDYLRANDFIILSVPAKELPFKTKTSLLDSEDDWPMRFITKQQFIKGINSKFIEDQGYYTIDVVSSTVIELLQPIIVDESAKPNRARIYYNAAFYNDKNEWVEKGAGFIEEANKILQWCQKNFKDKY